MLESNPVAVTRAVTGTVRTTTGVPIEGVIVMGSDLNYAETDKEGHFEIKNPEGALIFWCTGFVPRPQAITGSAEALDVVLNAL
ncbi:hypothetical protein F183_A36800 [Bryobacterales bacterium F-183]|nr:hypothetical protein F183_A36800 [Bryobacterales bacterium F-183]